MAAGAWNPKSASVEARLNYQTFVVNPALKICGDDPFCKKIIQHLAEQPVPKATLDGALSLEQASGVIYNREPEPYDSVVIPHKKLLRCDDLRMFSLPGPNLAYDACHVLAKSQILFFLRAVQAHRFCKKTGDTIQNALK
jgi:hypothetical protein